MRNDFLYKRLCSLYGTVQVAHEGCEREEYRVCCPYCGDTRFRLYISCLWGVPDLVAGHSNKNLINCYNEYCVNANRKKDPWNYHTRNVRRMQLYEEIYCGMAGAIELNNPTREEQVPTGPAEWPGQVISLDKLAEVKPEHKALKYMQSRNFDPVVLGRDHQFMYCIRAGKPEYAMVQGRIIMPIWTGDELYSWIGRYVGDDVGGIPLHKAGIKKYYNCPGRPLGRVGYNLDTVLCYSTIVIVEGMLDAIRTGPFATCLFTKSINDELVKSIMRVMQRHENPVVVIMLDPKQNEKDVKNHAPHHIEQTAERFEQIGCAKVLRVYLPIDEDPASMCQKDVINYIRAAAKQQNVKLNFRRIWETSESITPYPLAGNTRNRPGLVSYVEDRRRDPASKTPRVKEDKGPSG